MERRRRDFKFVAEGVFQRQAELARVRAKYGDKAFRQMQERQERERREAKRAASLNLDPNAMPLGERVRDLPLCSRHAAGDLWAKDLLPASLRRPLLHSCRILLSCSPSSVFFPLPGSHSLSISYRPVFLLVAEEPDHVMLLRLRLPPPRSVQRCRP